MELKTLGDDAHTVYTFVENIIGYYERIMDVLQRAAKISGTVIHKIKTNVRHFVSEYLKVRVAYGAVVPRFVGLQLMASERMSDTSDTVTRTISRQGKVAGGIMRGGDPDIGTRYMMASWILTGMVRQEIVKGVPVMTMSNRKAEGSTWRFIDLPYSLLHTPKSMRGVGMYPFSALGTTVDLMLYPTIYKDFIKIAAGYTSKIENSFHALTDQAVSKAKGIKLYFDSMTKEEVEAADASIVLLRASIPEEHHKDVITIYDLPKKKLEQILMSIRGLRFLNKNDANAFVPFKGEVEFPKEISDLWDNAKSIQYFTVPKPNPVGKMIAGLHDKVQLAFDMIGYVVPSSITTVTMNRKVRNMLDGTALGNVLTPEYIIAYLLKYDESLWIPLLIAIGINPAKADTFVKWLQGNRNVRSMMLFSKFAAFNDEFFRELSMDPDTIKMWVDSNHVVIKEISTVLFKILFAMLILTIMQDGVCRKMKIEWDIEKLSNWSEKMLY
jgi:hypothetical protein